MVKKFKDVNYGNHLLIIDLIDYLVDFNKLPFHNLVGTKDFMASLLSLLKMKDKPALQSKVLYLIKKWANKFENQKSTLTIFSDTFSTLINSGVVFPENIR
jgi:hypothetical protein